MLAILNSLGAGEAVAILVIALIVLGPEKLPDAIRKFGNIYGELRRMSHGFQSELRDAFDEPLRELRGTAQMMQDAVNEPVDTVTSVAKAPVVGGATKAADAPGDKPGETAVEPTTTETAASPAGEETQAPVEETVPQVPVEETQVPAEETQAPVAEDTTGEAPADEGQPVLAQAGLLVSEPELADPATNGQADETATAEQAPDTEPASPAPDRAADVAADAPQDR